MAPKKKTSTRKTHRELSGNSAKTSANGHSGHNGHNGFHHGHQNGFHHRDAISAHSNGHNGSAITLRSQTANALDTYFTNLNGHIPGELYNLVIREVEEPLFRAVLGYVDGNQSRAAEVLGINRGTLRKKLREYGLHDA